MQNNPLNVLIIGGGASGMMAAITAARRGANVIVLERMSRVGKKLLATGNGRCNLTNMKMAESNYHGSSGKFAIKVIKQFDAEKTITFFKELGLETYQEDDGKVFPVTNQASSVLDLLRYEMNRLNIAEICDSRVSRIETDGTKFLCVCTNDQRYYGNRIIIATGGKSSPNLGSNGGGYKLAESFGHRIVEPVPALVQICCYSPYLKALQGVKVNAQVSLLAYEKPLGRSTGEVLFTDYGLSGPPILHLSREVSLLENPKSSVIRLNVFPDISHSDLIDAIIDRAKQSPEKSIRFSFVGLLHKRLIDVILKESGIDAPDTECGSVSRKEIEKIAKTIQCLSFVCSSTQSWMHSQVTAGGVEIKGVDRRTLQSRMVPGLFFAGEVLDVDGDSGGYNLQWAWSSGYVAGSSV